MTNPILKRQAVRKFKNEKVTNEDVVKLIKAFQAAPCGMHQTDVMQASVVEDDHLRSKIETVTGNACYSAPLLFIINTKKGSQFQERDASVAAENVMVQAAEMDLGSVYIMAASELNNHPDLQKEIGMDKGFESTVIVAVGQPAEEIQPVDRDKRYRVIRK